MEYLNNYVGKVFRYIDTEKCELINEYVINGMTKGYRNVDQSEFINNNISYEEIEFLREYSGYNYKHINNALRGIWNYNDNGNIEAKDRFIRDGKRISDIIINNPSYVNKDFRVYRGVSIDYFKEYGIEKLEDIVNLRGQFMLDKGFVSTSISEKDSFFKKNNELGINYNVMITYLIPKEFDDGIFLYGDMTYSKNQKEYLINSYNIAKVVSVNINDDNTASIVAIIIPKRIYDEYYSNVNNQNRIR